MADVLLEVPISAPPERVYQAITEQAGLASWWTPDVSKAEPRIGSVAEFRFGTGYVPGENQTATFWTYLIAAVKTVPSSVPARPAPHAWITNAPCCGSVLNEPFITYILGTSWPPPAIVAIDRNAFWIPAG
jgi:hypothetical protein